MSKLSIYEDQWINMVFEGKNQEYGAYQLRQESKRTMLHAFIVGLILICSLTCITVLIKNFGEENVIQNTPPTILDEIIQVSLIKPEKPIVPKSMTLPITKKSEPDVIKKEQLINPQIAKPFEANDNIATNEEIKKTVTDESIGTATTGITTTTTTSGTEIPETKKPEIINTINTLDKLPEFPGGMKKFYTYVGNNFEKPELESSKTIKIYVTFVIEKDGSMTDINVIKDPGYGLGQEAIRVLKSLKTKWSPGIINGQSVRTSYNLPIVVEMR